MRLTDKPKSLAEMRPDISLAARRPDGDGQGPRARSTAPVSGRHRVRTRLGPGGRRHGRQAGHAADVTGSKRRPRNSRGTLGDAAKRPDGHRGRSFAGSVPVTPPPNRRRVLAPVAVGIAVLLVVSAALFEPILGRKKQPLAADTSSPPSAPGSPAAKTTFATSPETSQVAGAARGQPGRSSSSAPTSQTPDDQHWKRA